MTHSATQSGSNWVVNTTAESFPRDVFDRSRECPVVVDFWADWCQPCRLLGPVLEGLAAEYAGRFVLVKAETEKVPEAAAEFNVNGIPAVYAVVDGEVVDFFVGAQSRETIRGWLERIFVTAELARARRLEALEPARAEAVYRELMPKLPNEWNVPIGLARVLAGQRKDAEARETLDWLAKRGFLEPEAQKVLAELELRAGTGPGLAACQAAAAAAPEDQQAQLALGEALAATGDYAAALAVFLKIVPRDRAGAGERARQLMVDIFRVLPADSDLVREYRRKLASALY
jgi:putative thioredoxin